MRAILAFFDKLEDHVRFALSRHPLLYAFLAGVGAVLFFRGVWYAADALPFMTWPVTLIVSFIILAGSGTLVSHFVANDVLASGAKRGRKLSEESPELIAKRPSMVDISVELADIRARLERIEKKGEELRS